MSILRPHVLVVMTPPRVFPLPWVVELVVAEVATEGALMCLCHLPLQTLVRVLLRRCHSVDTAPATARPSYVPPRLHPQH